MKSKTMETGGHACLRKLTKRWMVFALAPILLTLIAATLVWHAGLWDTRPRGERLYAARCAGCHGEQGQGDMGMALDSTGHMYQHTCSQLTLHIAMGSRGSGYMPSYWGKLSSEEMTDIVISFQRWWTNEQIAEFQARTECPENDTLPSIMSR